MRAVPCVCQRRCDAERLLERKQPLDDADRRVERRAHRAALCFAVPAAVRELLAQQPIDESIAPDIEVRAEPDDAAVDAGLDLAFEEGRAAEPRSPGDALANAIDRGARARARRVEAEVAQEHQR